MPGCREVVQHQINGYIVPFKDHFAMVKAISRIIAEPEMAKMGEAGRQLVLQNFSEEIIARDTLKVWDELLQ